MSFSMMSLVMPFLAAVLLLPSAVALQLSSAGGARADSELTQGQPPLWSLVDLLPSTKLNLVRTDNPSGGGSGGRTVDVFIGSGGHGHTFPGATTPWGMVQATPWTHKASVDPWDTQSGYSAKALNPDFYGMAHSALSGAGSGEMGELRLMPLLPAYGNASILLTQTADASPGYFAAEVRPKLLTYMGPPVRVRSTATARGAVHEFELPEHQGPRVVKVSLSEAPDNFWGWRLDAFRSQVVSDRRFEGCTIGSVSGIGGAAAHMCFVVEFDQAFSSPPPQHKPYTFNSAGPSGFTDTAFVFPVGSSQTVTARVAVSRTDLEHARKAFESEVAGKSLQQVLDETRSSWNKALGALRVELRSPRRKRILYTALYHSMISPNLLSDADGSYRLQKASPGTFPRQGISVTFDNLEEKLPLRRAKGNGNIYHTFSSWDTYRSLHPLMNLIHPEVSRDFGESLMAFYDAWGYIPCWQLVQSPTDMMEGDGGSIILATMALNGVVDKQRSLDVLRAGRTKPVADQRRCLGSKECLQGKISELLEQAKADSCVGRLAKHLGQFELAEKFVNRSKLAFELWDEQQGVFAPLTSGTGLLKQHDRVDTETSSSQYMEGSPKQYAWSAEFDLPKMVELRKGEEGMACALDDFIYHSHQQKGAPDMSGSFGAISLGNEPTMHVPYLYSLVGYPARTQELVGRLLDGLFSDRADGLPGNDDLGQMSSWAIFSMLGFYPVDPCSGEYALGRPMVEQAELTLHDSAKLKIEVHGQSDESVYVQRLRWNGKDLDVTRPKLSFDMLSKGGLLEFWMSKEPALGQSLKCMHRQQELQKQDPRQERAKQWGFLH